MTLRLEENDSQVNLKLIPVARFWHNKPEVVWENPSTVTVDELWKTVIDEQKKEKKKEKKVVS